MSIHGTIKGHPITITIAEQDLLISANLSSSMLLNFMMGIYTMVYFDTVYKYFTKRGPNSQRHIVISSITLLYILCLINFAIEWSFLQWSLVNEGATRALTYAATISGGPEWMHAAITVLQSLMMIVSDGLLLWRCFNLWNRSWRMIAFPLFLTVTESILTIPLSYINIHGNPVIFNALLSTFLCITVVSTLLTTTLIGYRVYRKTSSTRATAMGNSAKSRFRHIFHVILESAAIYSVVMLWNALLNFIPSTADDLGVASVLEIYTSTMLSISAGLAPTILVARVITAQSTESDIASIHISGLQFQSQPPAHQDDQDGSQLTGSPNFTDRRGHVVDSDPEIGNLAPYNSVYEKVTTVGGSSKEKP